MKVGDLVRMRSRESVCYDEVGVVLEVYPRIERQLVLFWNHDCKIACLESELDVISENYYLDEKQGEA